MNRKQFISFFCLFMVSSSLLFSEEDTPKYVVDEGVGVSSNPSPSDHIGTGEIADQIFESLTGRKNETGFSLETLWILDGNRLLSGGKSYADRTTINNLLQFELLFDPGKVSNWKGGLFSVQYMKLDGAPTNANALLVQGFEGLIQTPPLDRSCLYAYWYRQEFKFYNQEIITRIGKSTPNSDFNAVNRLFPMNDKRISPVASGVIYGTIFTQGSLAAFMPSYYNSAFGASIFYFPLKSFYMSLGGYDGNKGRGEETGLRGPQFNGYYFLITESGYSWSDAELPGRIAIGVWKQTGELTADASDGTLLTQQGVYGIYLYGSQRLWWKADNSNGGVVTYLQLGINNTKTLAINKFLGCGITALGLVPGRLKDSFGVGVSLAGLNRNVQPRPSEWMLQTYYQCCLFDYFYLEPVISYIPNPGVGDHPQQTWAASVRLLGYF